MFRFWLPAVISLLNPEPAHRSGLLLVGPEVAALGAVCFLPALALGFAVCFTLVSWVSLRRRLSFLLPKVEVNSWSCSLASNTVMRSSLLGW